MSAPTAVAIKSEAAFKAAKRRREARLAILRDQSHGILERFAPWIGERADRDDVTKLYAVRWVSMRSTVNRYRDELVALGYDPTDHTFSRDAALYLCLLMRPATTHVGGEMAKAMGVVRRQPMEFQGPTSHGGHVNRCTALLGKAATLAADVRDIDPAEVWVGLDKLTRYEVQALAVALATLIDPLADGNPATWLVDLSTNRCTTGSQGRGLGLLVPTKASVAAGGVPIGELDPDTENL